MTRITEKTKRLLIGKTIESVRTEDCESEIGSVTHIATIYFTDGSRLGLGTAELEGDYATEGIYRPKGRP